MDTPNGYTDAPQKEGVMSASEVTKLVEYARAADIGDDPLVVDLANEVERLASIIERALAATDSVPLMDDKYGTHVDRKVMFDLLSEL